MIDEEVDLEARVRRAWEAPPGGAAGAGRDPAFVSSVQGSAVVGMVCLGTMLVLGVIAFLVFVATARWLFTR